MSWWEPKAEPRGEISSFVRAFSHSYQDRLGQLIWDQKVFNEIYDRFERFLYSKDLIITSISPIYLFECDLKKPVKLDTDIGIIPKEYDVNIKNLLSYFEAKHKFFSENFEWCIYTHKKVSKAQLREDILGDHKHPTALDMPEAKIYLSSNLDPGSPFGAKGCGEGPANTPAAANAVYNAIGVRIRDSSITPDKILKALGKA